MPKKWLYLGWIVLCINAYACDDDQTFSPIEVGGAINAGGQAGEMLNGGEMITGGRPVENQGGEPVGMVASLVPGPVVWAKLTESQYRNMVNDVLGVDCSDLPLEPDTNPYLFTSIGAGRSSLSSYGAEQYVEAAFVIADRYFEHMEQIELDLGCTPMAVDDGCADQMLRNLGFRLYRRPLSETELEHWKELARNTATSDRPDGQIIGLKTALAAMLQSPFVLYRLEIGEYDAQNTDRRYFTSLELASRIAFTLQNTSPDLELLTLALAGHLLDEEVLDGQIERLLETERARHSIESFFAQYLDLSRLAHVDRDPAVYTGFNQSLLSAMETEVRLLVDDIVYRRDGDIRRLFNERRGYMNAELAAHYGISVEGVSPIIFESVDFPDDTPRVGFLGTAAFLTMNAHPTETSPTLRGKYIRERLLCQIVPPPPDDIDLNLEAETGEVSTLRERLERHREDPACAGCHSFIDPPGFLFERFDSVGRYREELNGVVLDASGDLDGVPMADLSDLADHLAQDARLTMCMVRQVYRFALGRLEEYGEEVEIQSLHQQFASQGFRFKQLIKSLLLSEGFRVVGTQSANESTEGTMTP